MTAKQDIKRTAFCFGLCMVALFGTASCILSQGFQLTETGWDDALAKHSIVTDQSKILSELWQQEVFFPQGLGGVTITAGGGQLYLIGSVEQTEPERLIALDALTGNLRWRKERVDAMALAGESIFYGDGSNVYAANRTHGTLIWETHLLLANIIVYIYPFEEHLQIFTGSHEFFLLDKNNGEVLERSTSRNVFFHAPHWLMQRKPVFWEESIIYREGVPLERITSIRSVEIGTIDFHIIGSGELLWESDRHIISNAAVSKDYAFMIDAFDKLLIRDKDTGEIVEAIEIVPSINIYNNNGASQQEGYHLAFDDQSNILFVALGDGYQLFAFEVTE